MITVSIKYADSISEKWTNQTFSLCYPHLGQLTKFNCLREHEAVQTVADMTEDFGAVAVVFNKKIRVFNRTNHSLLKEFLQGK
jgi:hypothetical protein